MSFGQRTLKLTVVSVVTIKPPRLWRGRLETAVRVISSGFE
jgi:hypothetical protein